MCRFVTATLPATASVDVLDALARSHGRRFLSLSSPAVAGQLASGEAYFLTTLGHCDCDEPVGVRRATQEEIEAIFHSAL